MHPTNASLLLVKKRGTWPGKGGCLNLKQLVALRDPWYQQVDRALYQQVGRNVVRVAWLTIRVPKDARARKKPTCGYPFATQIACILCSATEGTTFLATCLNLHAKHLLGMQIYCLAYCFARSSRARSTCWYHGCGAINVVLRVAWLTISKATPSLAYHLVR